MFSFLLIGIIIKLKVLVPILQVQPTPLFQTVMKILVGLPEVESYLEGFLKFHAHILCSLVGEISRRVASLVSPRGKRRYRPQNVGIVPIFNHT